MGHRFLIDNRRFLKTCWGMAWLYGVTSVILAGGRVVVTTMTILIVYRVLGAEHSAGLLAAVFIGAPLAAFRGLLAVVVAEFISYLVAEEDRPRWLFRHGELVIYAYACFLLMGRFQTAFFSPDVTQSTAEHSLYLWSSMLALPEMVAIALTWVGIGITLRKVLPIIRESKTLV